MITVIAKKFVNLDKIDDFKKYSYEMIEETRKEEGNIAYNLFQDINNEVVFTIIEEWRSKDDLKKHMEAEHFKKLVPRINEFQERNTEVNVFTRIK